LLLLCGRVISITPLANDFERMFPISRLFGNSRLSGNEGHPSLQQEKGT
jgi:hypothetical protein